MAVEIKTKAARSSPDLRSRSAPIIERAPLPIVEVQGSAHIVSYVNSAFCSLLGKAREELLGKPFAEIVPRGDQCVPILDRVYETGEAVTHAQEDDSEPAYWLYAMWPTLDANERPEGVIIQLTKAANFRQNTTAINEALLISGLRQHELTEAAEKLNEQFQAEIVERKAAEEKLRKSEMETKRARDYAEATLRTAPIPLLVLADDLRVNTANEAFYKNFQVAPAETEGALIYDLGNRQWNIPKLRELLEDILPKNNWFNNFEITHEFETIGRRTMLLNARRMENEAGQPLRIVLAIEDITERKQAEEELRVAMAEIERGSRAKDDFLAALSHELRTPLTPALMTAAALETDPALPLEVRDQLGMMRRNIELEARLIDDLLDLTRINNGKLQIQPVAADIHQLLEQTAEIVRGDGLGKQVRVVFKLEAARHHAMGDPARLQQVFWNIIKNAFKFTAANGSVTVSTRNGAAGTVIVSITDTGIGIRAEALPQIFEAFEQGEITFQQRFGGLGLGLAISRAIVEMHGGEIHAESEGVGRGATFSVTFATVDAPELLDGAQSAPPALDRALRLLVVDDHEATLAVLTRLLTRSGHHVTPASSVRDGLAAAAIGTFDAVISDLGLPDGSGLDLIREIRREHAWPGIALSGYGMDEDLRRSQQAGFSAHLTKPIDLAQLERALEDLMTDDSPIPR